MKSDARRLHRTGPRYHHSAATPARTALPAVVRVWSTGRAAKPRFRSWRIRERLRGMDALANLADVAGTVSIEATATAPEGYDKARLENGVLEPLRVDRRRAGIRVTRQTDA